MKDMPSDFKLRSISEHYINNSQITLKVHIEDICSTNKNVFIKKSKELYIIFIERKIYKNR